MAKTEKETLHDYFSAIGKKGGSVTGRPAGRKPIPDEERTPEQKKRRARYEIERQKKTNTPN